MSQERNSTSTMKQAKVSAKPITKGRYVLSEDEQHAVMLRRIEELKNSDRATKIKFLQKAGVVDKEGKLAEPYRCAA